MKTFKYRWAKDDEKYVGEKDSLDERTLRKHIEGVGGNLIEILEVAEKKEVVTKSSPQEVKVDKEEPFNPPANYSNKQPIEGSIGVKIIAWFYFIGAIFAYVIAVIMLIAALIKGGITIGGNLTNNIWVTLGIFGLIILSGTISAVIGFGLLWVYKWAHIVVLIFASIGVIGSVFAIIQHQGRVSIESFFFLWFFARKSVRKQFWG